MPRGTTLAELVEALKLELSQSNNPALGQNVRASYVRRLQRQQRRLYIKFAWPFLRVERTVPLLAGERTYALPDDLEQDRVEEVWHHWGGQPRQLTSGIRPELYGIRDPTLDMRDEVVRAYDWSDNQQFVLWPIPAASASRDALDRLTSGYIRFVGLRKLRQLVGDEDTCDLDDDMVVLFCAAEILAREKAKNAQAVLEQAQDLYRSLTTGAKPKRGARLNLARGGANTRPRGTRVLVAQRG